MRVGSDLVMHHREFVNVVVLAHPPLAAATFVLPAGHATANRGLAGSTMEDDSAGMQPRFGGKEASRLIGFDVHRKGSPNGDPTVTGCPATTAARASHNPA